MLKKRIIPVILLKNGRVVQSKLFKRHQVLGNSSLIASRFSNWNVDELIILDISREKKYDINREDLNYQNLDSILAIFKDFSRKSFMPLTLGGGVKTLSDIEDRLRAGADKVAINSAAIHQPDFLEKAAGRFGSQALVASIDALELGTDCWEVFTDFGKTATGLNPLNAAQRLESAGAGEILVNSINRDGQCQGFDMPLISAVTESVNVPVIGLGGGGTTQHFVECFENTKVSALAASNIFQYTEQAVFNLNHELNTLGINIRPAAISNMETF